MEEESKEDTLAIEILLRFRDPSTRPERAVLMAQYVDPYPIDESWWRWLVVDELWRAIFSRRTT